MAPIISIRDYTWRYLNTQKPALDGISLDIHEGEFVGIVGPNGSGKTTLALSVDGLIPGQYHGVKNGEVLVYGKEVEAYRAGELQKIIGMVFSDPESQFTAMTVEDELVFGMENLGMTIPQIRERLAWVTDLAQLEPLLEKPPYEVSGGQKQRVALAAVLAMQPEVMILDEPTSMLDPISRVRVFEVLAKLRQEGGRTIVVIEHCLEHLAPLTDRMVLLHNGKVVLTDTTEAFFRQTDLLLEQGVFPPEVTQLFHLLTRDGPYTGPLPLTLDEAAGALRQLLA